MSKFAKISFLIAFLLLIASFAIQIMSGAWINLNTVLLAVAAGFVVLALVVDYKMYWEFLTMRTTKHGLNMGAGILLVLVLLVCVNYLANRYNKNWDLTQEKLNSLSDQSMTLVKGLKDDVEIKVFTRGPGAQEEKQRIKQNLALFQDLSPHLKVRFVNPYVDNDLAMQYLNDLPDRDNTPAFFFIERGGKRIRVEQPFDEAAITAGLIKATRSGASKVYFLKGHGEKDIESDSDQSVRDFAQSLKESSFTVESLSLLDQKAVPDDAAVIAIVGPALPYLDSELAAIRDYLSKGGKLFLALDPGQRHNLANLTKSLGVEFQNNFIITVAPVTGGGPAMILGRNFDGSNAITKSFPAGSSYSLFYVASEVKGAADKPPTIQTADLVKTDTFSFTMSDLQKPLAKKPETKSVVMAMTSKGTLEGNKDSKPFEAVIFGDSDFISNQSLIVGVNRDLAMNSFAHLANQTDLISIRPKVPKGTMIFLTGTSRLIMIVFTMALPLILLVASGVMWYRRRGA